MAVVLLIIGLTLFLLGTLGLIVRFRERDKPALSVLMPMVSAPFARQCWSDVRFFVLARLLGLALVAAGIGVAVARDPLILEEPRRLWGVERQPYIAGSERVEMNRFVNASDAILMAIRRDTSVDLSGRIHGREFTYDRVELIDGVLSASQGTGFLPELEVRIFLQSELKGASFGERQTVSVQPSDPVAPEIHLSWRDTQGQLQTRIIRRGYRMELQLARIDRHQLKGFLRLILPDSMRSFVSGEFVAYTSHLRYQDGTVDRGYSHPDTLEYVARQYLNHQYPSGAIEQISFSHTRIQGSRTEGRTVARIRLDGGRVERREIGLQLSRGEWVVQRESVTRKVVQGGDDGNAAEVAQNEQAQEPDERNHQSSVTGKASSAQPKRIPFADLRKHVGERIRTRRTDGKLQEGRLQSVEDDRITLKTNLSGGTVQYYVDRGKLDEVQLADGTRLIVGTRDTENASATEVGADSRSDEQRPEDTPGTAEEATRGGEDSNTETRPDLHARLRKLEGKRIEITAQDGKSRIGRLTRLGEREVRLTVPIGGGSVDYYYEPAEIRTVRRADTP